MFAPHPEVAIKEMLQVTKNGGGHIAFTTWPSELANDRTFKVIAKHMFYYSAFNGSSEQPVSPLLRGIP